MVDREVLPTTLPSESIAGAGATAPDDNAELGQLFYRQILPTSLVPETTLPPDVEPIIGQVVDDKTLVLDGTAHVLRGHQLNIFNSIIYQRTQGRLSASQLMRFGFHASAPEATRRYSFAPCMKYLMEKLVVGDQGVIIPTGYAKGRRYHILPQFQIVDERETGRPEDPRNILYAAISSRLTTAKEHTVVGPPHNKDIQIFTITDDTIAHEEAGKRRHETLNKHELTLLNLFLLTEKQALTHEELRALGFHLYAQNYNGWASALYRTIHSLGTKLSLDASGTTLSTETFANSSFVRLKRHFTVINNRASGASDTRLAEIVSGILQKVHADDPVLPDIKRDPRPAGMREPSTVSAAQVDEAFSAGLITLREAITLSLRSGEYYPFLKGTELPTVYGLQNYDDLYAHTEGKGPLSGRYVGELFGLGTHAIDHIRSAASGRLPAREEADKSKQHDEKKELEAVPKAETEQSLQESLSGDNATHLASRSIRKQSEDPLPLTTREYVPRAWGARTAPPKPATPPPISDKSGSQLPPPSGRPASHLAEIADAWRPAALADRSFISLTEHLTAEDVASRLGIATATVQQAINRIIPGDTRPKESVVDGQRRPVYHGSMLLAIREQLVGVPLEYAQRLFGLSPANMVRARSFLTRSGYQIFDGDRCSPGAFRVLADNIGRITAPPVES